MDIAAAFKPDDILPLDTEENNRDSDSDEIIGEDLQRLYDENRREAENQDDFAPTAQSITLWIGMEVSLRQQKGKKCSSKRICRGVDMLKDFWESKSLGWKLLAEDNGLIGSCIRDHIKDGNIVRRKFRLRRFRPRAYRDEKST